MVFPDPDVFLAIRPATHRIASHRIVSYQTPGKERFLRLQALAKPYTRHRQHTPSNEPQSSTKPQPRPLKMAEKHLLYNLPPLQTNSPPRPPFPPPPPRSPPALALCGSRRDIYPAPALPRARERRAGTAEQHLYYL